MGWIRFKILEGIGDADYSLTGAASNVSFARGLINYLTRPQEPMNQADAIESISKALATLTYQVRQENFSGLFSKNRLLEDLLLPAFALILPAPSLRNLNVLGQNNAYLDLGADGEHLGVQVTTENNAAKITKTLRGVIDAKLYKQYTRVIIFMLQDNRPNFRKATKDAWTALCGRKLKFMPDRDIIALPQMLSLITGRPYSDINKLQRLFAQSVVGEEYVDALAAVLRVTTAHLAYEKRTARYIPGVFIETRETDPPRKTMPQEVGNFRLLTRPGKLCRRRLEIFACDPPRKTMPQEVGNFRLHGSVGAGFTGVF